MKTTTIAGHPSKAHRMLKFEEITQDGTCIPFFKKNAIQRKW
jgi:hypothetical protein